MNKPTVADFTASLKLKGTTWQGTTGYRALDADRILKVEITQEPRSGYATSGTYIGLKLSIVSKTSGRIDDTAIYFNEIGFTRGDGRKDYADDYKVISHCGWDWYIARPKFIAPLAKAVEAYASLFV